MEDSHEYVQFVCFKTAGNVPSELFQQSWIPIARSFIARGINTIILSEKVSLQSDLSPYRFVSKNWWESLTAVKLTFPQGLPPPSGRGHITASQGGIFQVVSKTDLDKHMAMVKGAIKVFTMIPAIIDPPSQDIISAYSDYLTSLGGFQSVCVYQIDESSGPVNKDWLYRWVVEAYYDPEMADAASLLKGIVSSAVFSTNWEVSVHKDDMQLTP